MKPVSIGSKRRVTGGALLASDHLIKNPGEVIFHSISTPMGGKKKIENPVKKKRTSHHEASNGQRFPRLYSLVLFHNSNCSRTAAMVGKEELKKKVKGPVRGGLRTNQKRSEGQPEGCKA